MSKDTIYRQAAIDVLHGYFDGALETDTICPKDIYNLFEIIPSAEPEVLACGEGELSAHPDDAALHESCTDCPLYDHDRHRCPRFNKVIPTTIQEILDTQTQKWIPVTERLPVEGESVLLCNSYGDMTLGRLVRTNEGCNWDIYAWWCDIYDWVAWMPLPEPYREEDRNEQRRGD